MLQQCVTPPLIWQFFSGDSGISLACQSLLMFPTEATRMGVWTYLGVFVLTCVLETPFYFYGLTGLPARRRGLAIFALNLATHPLVTWGWPFLFAKLGRSYGELVLASEIFAPLVEMLILHFAFHQSWRRSALVAIAANLFSWWVGPFVAVAIGLSG